MIRNFSVNWKAFAGKRIRARFYTARVEKNFGFSQRKFAHVYSPVFHSARFLGSQPPVEIFSAHTLQTCVDIGRDIADVVLQDGVAVLQGGLHLADGVEHGGMILAELAPDIRQT